MELTRCMIATLFTLPSLSYRAPIHPAKVDLCVNLRSYCTLHDDRGHPLRVERIKGDAVVRTPSLIPLLCSGGAR
eukprot:23178-Eustigmatos_ZCMA.PRE.1